MDYTQTIVVRRELLRELDGRQTELVALSREAIYRSRKLLDGPVLGAWITAERPDRGDPLGRA